jgi:hypothetical protein
MRAVGYGLLLRGLNMPDMRHTMQRMRMKGQVELNPMYPMMRGW